LALTTLLQEIMVVLVVLAVELIIYPQLVELVQQGKVTQVVTTLIQETLQLAAVEPVESVVMPQVESVVMVA
jgi:hypothetical protein